MAASLRRSVLSAALLALTPAIALAGSPTTPARSAPADSAALPDSTSRSATKPAVSPSAPAILRVETEPPGLKVLVDGAYVGVSPIDSLRLPAKTVLVRVLASDPRRFDPARDAATVTLRSGAAVTVFLDVRPSVLLRSEPEPAYVLLTDRPAGLPDTLLGETPLALSPSWLREGRFRFGREAYADTVLAGSAFLDSGENPPRVALRRSGLAPPRLGPVSRTPLLRRRWLQWSLVGVGAALSGAAIAFHHQGDIWYERYLASSDVDRIPGLYDQAVRSDRKAALSLGSGQACLVGGLVLLLIGQSR